MGLGVGFSVGVDVGTGDSVEIGEGAGVAVATADCVGEGIGDAVFFGGRVAIKLPLLSGEGASRLALGNVPVGDCKIVPEGVGVGKKSPPNNDGMHEAVEAANRTPPTMTNNTPRCLTMNGLFSWVWTESGAVITA